MARVDPVAWAEGFNEMFALIAGEFLQAPSRKRARGYLLGLLSQAERSRRGIDNFPEIISRLASIAGRFATALDCADVSFIATGFLDQLPLPSQLGAVRADGIDLNKPRIRAVLAAANLDPQSVTGIDFARRRWTA